MNFPLRAKPTREPNRTASAFIKVTIMKLSYHKVIRMNVISPCPNSSTQSHCGSLGRDPAGLDGFI